MLVRVGEGVFVTVAVGVFVEVEVCVNGALTGTVSRTGAAALKFALPD